MATPHGILISVILLAGLVLAAGCTTSSSVPASPAGSTIVPMTSAPPIVASPMIATPALTQCPQENSTRFINISPVPDHYFGDLITINGTTNLPAGDRITLTIIENTQHPCNKGICNDSVRYCCGTFQRTVAVRSGGNGINTWSLDVNTSQHEFDSYSYIVSASERNYQIETIREFVVLDR
jgi:hypothetical protein